MQINKYFDWQGKVFFIWLNNFTLMAPKHIKTLNSSETIAERFTSWLGSPVSIVVHTIVFIAAFALVLFGVAFDSVLLILTTAVSLEAIYLALFIQMTVNKNTRSLADVEEDIEEIAEDVEGIEKDIDEIEKDIDEMQEDVEEIEKDADEDDRHDAETMKTLGAIQSNMLELMKDIQALKNQKK
jgi:low affinity Fe/Cu permease